MPRGTGRGRSGRPSRLLGWSTGAVRGNGCANEDLRRVRGALRAALSLLRSRLGRAPLLLAGMRWQREGPQAAMRLRVWSARRSPRTPIRQPSRQPLPARPAAEVRRSQGALGSDGSRRHHGTLVSGRDGEHRRSAAAPGGGRSPQEREPGR